MKIYTKAKTHRTYLYFGINDVVFQASQTN